MAFHRRGVDHEFKRVCASLRGQWRKYYDEVLRKRRVDVPFTVEYDPNDGKGAKLVHCLNLTWQWPKKITNPQK